MLVARSSPSVYGIFIGPPGESAGVTVDSASTTTTSTRLYWTAGAANGRPIDYHVIEGRTEHNQNWVLLIPSKT